ncbi:MAG TPA: hypothetical protein VFX59_26620 [Polyangiales bacterium]|nr:hypothetical protein [Polyangiales bacterium]
MSSTLLLRTALALATVLGAAHCASSDPATPGPTDQTGDDTTGTRDAGRMDAKVPSPTPDAAGSKDAGGARDSGSAIRLDAGRLDAGESDAGDPRPSIVDTYVKLDIAATTPFDKAKADKHPFDAAAIAGWSWYNIDGAKCRDGSQFGVYVHWGEDPTKLFVYFEGGGACANPGFCDLNPKNVGEQFLTGGESAVASLFLLPAPQGPTARACSS